MKVFIIIVIVVSGLGFIPLMQVMAKSAVLFNVSEFKPSRNTIIDKITLADPLVKNANLRSVQHIKKSTASRERANKLKKARKYQIDKKKLLLVLSILRKR
jgi:short-subunit dehydrogenase involved in D-alanine esterification of teichoic acids